MTAYKKRRRDFAFMSWVKSQQCAVCYPNLDAEFIPGTANASDGAEPSAPEANK